MVQLDRVQLPYSNDSSRFVLSKEDMSNAFQRQYFHVYRSRLDALKPRILAAAEALGLSSSYKQLEGLVCNEKTLVIGTIEKRISLRPSILKELAEEERMLPEDAEIETEADQPNLVSSKDFLEFEDEKQIVKLQGNITMDEVATGCTVGLYGYQVKDDVFHVEQCIWPLPEPQLAWPTTGRHGATIAFVSGLELTGNVTLDSATTLAFSVMSRWMNGEMALSTDEKTLAASVERLVVAGDSIFVGQAREFSSVVGYLKLAQHDATPSGASIGQLDRLLAKMTSKMCVDVMSGTGDPTTQLWPQQAIHRACLPLASLNGAALGLVTNPYHFTLGGLEMIATSGQNVTDLRRLSAVSSSCDVMDLLVRWQHLAPTAPDTVDAFPLEGRDPFALPRVPHVMITGNQPRAEHRWTENEHGKTLLISLPRFSRTHTVTLLNMETMTVSYKYFGAV